MGSLQSFCREFSPNFFGFTIIFVSFVFWNGRERESCYRVLDESGHTHVCWMRFVTECRTSRFCKRATNYRALLRKMTHEDKASWVSSLSCTHCWISQVTRMWNASRHMYIYRALLRKMTHEDWAGHLKYLRHPVHSVERFRSHVWGTRHVTCIWNASRHRMSNESCHTMLNESCHTLLNESCHTYDKWAMSLINGPCHW